MILAKEKGSLCKGQCAIGLRIFGETYRVNSNGTLGELSTAYLNRKPVVVLEPSGGWAGKVRAIAYEEAYLDERKSIELAYAQTAQEALDIALTRIGNCT